MKRSERIGGKAVPLRRAETAAEVGLLLKPGVIVEMDPETGRRVRRLSGRLHRLARGPRGSRGSVRVRRRGERR